MLIGVWIVGSTVLLQAVTWAIEQFLIISGLTMPVWAWPVAVWLNAAIAGLPAILLATLARRPAVRVTGRVWGLSALVLGIVGSVRAVPAQQSDIYFAVLTIVAAGVAATCHATVGHGSLSRSVSTKNQPKLVYGVAAGVAVLVPWLWVGALGGLIESVVAVTAAGAVGWLAAEVLRPLWPYFVEPRAAGARTIGRTLAAGLVAGTALMPVAAAIGGSGPNLAEMAFLPPLGFVAAALSGRGGAPLFAIAALGPLAFVEADETTVALGLHDVGFWTLVGGGISLGVAIVAGVTAVVTRTRGKAETRWRRLAAPIALATVVAAGAVVYPLAGHPGFFGEGLFVVMKQQADLTGLAQIPDRDARLRATYDRLVTTADRTQASLRAKLTRDGISFTPYYLVNGIEVTTASRPASGCRGAPTSTGCC